MKDYVMLRSYPKAIFLWPIILCTVIAWLTQMFVSPYIAIITASELNNILAHVWLMVLFLSLAIVTFEFRKITTFITIIVISTGLLLVIFLLWPVIGINLNEFEIFELELNLPTEFYMTLTLMFLIIYLMMFLVNRFRYYKIERNEIFYKENIFSGAVRYPTKNLRFKHEITDVFEYFILRSGRITILLGEHEIAVLNNVLNVNKKVGQIDYLLSHIAVEPDEVDNGDLFSPLKPDEEYALEQVNSKYKEYKKSFLGHAKYKDEVKIKSEDLIPKLREVIKNQPYMYVEEIGDKLLGITKTNTASESQNLLEVDFKPDRAIFKGYGDNRIYTKKLVDFTTAEFKKFTEDTVKEAVDEGIREFRESFEEHRKEEEEFRKEYKLSSKKADIKMSLNIFLEKPEQLKEYFKEVIESDWPDEEKDLWAEVMQELLKEWEEFEPEKWEKIADFLLDIAESIPIAGGIGKVVTKGIRVLINWIKSRR